MLAGAILTGGASSRMGQPKPGVVLPNGQTMLAHVINALQPVCSEIILLGAFEGFTPNGKTMLLPDNRPGEGPLAGIETLLASGRADRYLVTSCDQALLKPALLKALADHTPPSEAGFFCDITNISQIQPFPGIYPALWKDVSRALNEGRRSIGDVIRQSTRPIHWEGLDNPRDIRQLTSINTPADIALHF